MKKTAIIIGSGFGGLALGIRLQKSGINTIIIEQRDKPGGRAYVYKKDGFIFDSGPTLITDPNCIKELFQILNLKIENYIKFIPINPFYRLCWENGKTLNINNNIQEIEKQIKKINYNDLKGYRNFIKYSKLALKKGYIKYSTYPFISFKNMIYAVPTLIKLKAWKSVYNIVSHYIKNIKLRQALSFHSLLIGGNPFQTSSIYTLINALELKWGVWFPHGGTGKIVKALVKIYKNIGGKIIFNSRVNKINTNNNYVINVIINNKKKINANIIISNADIINTYGKLLIQHKLGKNQFLKLKNKQISNSLFIIYFGLKKIYNKLAHHNIYFRYCYNKNIDNIFNKNPNSICNFSFYLHSPSITDNSLAPPGCGTFYALVPVPNLKKNKINWKIEGNFIKNEIFNYLEKFEMPNLKKNIITYKILTPYDFQKKLDAYLGTAFSISPLITQSAWFRPHNRDRFFKNLYFVGAGTHPGAGIPGVIASAKVTANIILKDFNLI